MKMWRRPSLAMLALLALFASLLPQLAWACPMTGRIGPASMVCASMPVGGDDAATPCRHMGGKCCKPLSLPPQPSENEKSHPTFNAVALVAVDFVLAPAPVAVVPVFEAPAPTPIPDLRLWLTKFTTAPPPRLSRYGPSALAGRAPPVA